MKEILQNIQTHLSQIKELKYIDEDWGQLSYFADFPPVQFPCCLIAFENGQFTNISKDLSKRPKDRQNGIFSVKITLAHLKLANTSLKSPQHQKESAWAIFELLEKIHQQLHGFCPTENSSKMLRASFGKVQRDDGVQEYFWVYQVEVFNV